MSANYYDNIQGYRDNTSAEYYLNLELCERQGEKDRADNRRFNPFYNGQKLYGLRRTFYSKGYNAHR